MSRSEGRHGSQEGDPLEQLEQAVEKALVRIRDLETRLGDAERRATALDQVFTTAAGGEERPSVLMDRVKQLEAENEDMKERLARGLESVERLLARIRFLEEQR
jgi:hypothetical protein